MRDIEGKTAVGSGEGRGSGANCKTGEKKKASGFSIQKSVNGASWETATWTALAAW